MDMETRRKMACDSRITEESSVESSSCDLTSADLGTSLESEEASLDTSDSVAGSLFRHSPRKFSSEDSTSGLKQQRQTQEFFENQVLMSDLLMGEASPCRAPPHDLSPVLVHNSKATSHTSLHTKQKRSVKTKKRLLPQQEFDMEGEVTVKPITQSTVHIRTKMQGKEVTVKFAENEHNLAAVRNEGVKTKSRTLPFRTSSEQDLLRATALIKENLTNIVENYLVQNKTSTVSPCKAALDRKGYKQMMKDSHLDSINTLNSSNSLQRTPLLINSESADSTPNLAGSYKANISSGDDMSQNIDCNRTNNVDKSLHYKTKDIPQGTAIAVLMDHPIGEIAQMLDIDVDHKCTDIGEFIDDEIKVNVMKKDMETVITPAADPTKSVLQVTMQNCIAFNELSISTDADLQTESSTNNLVEKQSSDQITDTFQEEIIQCELSKTNHKLMKLTIIPTESSSNNLTETQSSDQLTNQYREKIILSEMSKVHPKLVKSNSIEESFDIDSGPPSGSLDTPCDRDACRESDDTYSNADSLLHGHVLKKTLNKNSAVVDDFATEDAKDCLVPCHKKDSQEHPSIDIIDETGLSCPYKESSAPFACVTEESVVNVNKLGSQLSDVASEGGSFESLPYNALTSQCGSFNDDNDSQPPVRITFHSYQHFDSLKKLDRQYGFGSDDSQDINELAAIPSVHVAPEHTEAELDQFGMIDMNKVVADISTAGKDDLIVAYKVNDIDGPEVVTSAAPEMSSAADVMVAYPTFTEELVTNDSQNNEKPVCEITLVLDSEADGTADVTSENNKVLPSPADSVPESGFSSLKDAYVPDNNCSEDSPEMTLSKSKDSLDLTDNERYLGTDTLSDDIETLPESEGGGVSNFCSRAVSVDDSFRGSTSDITSTDSGSNGLRQLHSCGTSRDLPDIDLDSLVIPSSPAVKVLHCQLALHTTPAMQESIELVANKDTAKVSPSENEGVAESMSNRVADTFGSEEGSSTDFKTSDSISSEDTILSKISMEEQNKSFCNDSSVQLSSNQSKELELISNIFSTEPAEKVSPDEVSDISSTDVLPKSFIGGFENGIDNQILLLKDSSSEEGTSSKPSENSFILTESEDLSSNVLQLEKVDDPSAEVLPICAVYSNSSDNPVNFTVDAVESDLVSLLKKDLRNICNIPIDSSSAALTGVVQDSAALAGVVQGSAALTGVVQDSAALTGVVQGSAALTVVQDSAALTGVVQDSAALTAVVQDSAALTAVVHDSAALTTVVRDSAALTVVVHDSAAVTTVVQDSAALTAAVQDSAALTTVQDSATVTAVIQDFAALTAVQDSEAPTAVVQDSPALTAVVRDSADLTAVVQDSAALTAVQDSAPNLQFDSQAITDPCDVLGSVESAVPVLLSAGKDLSGSSRNFSHETFEEKEIGSEISIESLINKPNEKPKPKSTHHKSSSSHKKRRKQVLVPDTSSPEDSVTEFPSRCPQICDPIGSTNSAHFLKRINSIASGADIDEHTARKISLVKQPLSESMSGVSNVGSATSSIYSDDSNVHFENASLRSEGSFDKFPHFDAVRAQVKPRTPKKKHHSMRATKKESNLDLSVTLPEESLLSKRDNADEQNLKKEHKKGKEESKSKKKQKDKDSDKGEKKSAMSSIKDLLKRTKSKDKDKDKGTNPEKTSPSLFRRFERKTKSQSPSLKSVSSQPDERPVIEIVKNSFSKTSLDPSEGALHKSGGAVGTGENTRASKDEKVTRSALYQQVSDDSSGDHFSPSALRRSGAGISPHLYRHVLTRNLSSSQESLEGCATPQRSPRNRPGSATSLQAITSSPGTGTKAVNHNTVSVTIGFKPQVHNRNRTMSEASHLDRELPSLQDKFTKIGQSKQGSRHSPSHSGLGKRSASMEILVCGKIREHCSANDGSMGKLPREGNFRLHKEISVETLVEIPEGSPRRLYHNENYQDYLNRVQTEMDSQHNSTWSLCDISEVNTIDNFSPASEPTSLTLPRLVSCSRQSGPQQHARLGKKMSLPHNIYLSTDKERGSNPSVGHGSSPNSSRSVSFSHSPCRRPHSSTGVTGSSPALQRRLYTATPLTSGGCSMDTVLN